MKHEGLLKRFADDYGDSISRAKRNPFPIIKRSSGGWVIRERIGVGAVNPKGLRGYNTNIIDPII